MYKYIVFFFLVLVQNVFAQGSAAEQNIKSLKNGFLVVEIPTDYKKINELENRINKNSNDPSYALRIRELLTYTIEKNQKVQKGIIEGIQKKYTFSKVVMVYDSSENIFFDKNMNPIPDFSLKNQKYFTLRYKNWIKSQTTTELSFRICDEKKEPLPVPFPTTVPYKFYFKRLLSKSNIFVQNSSKEDQKKYTQIYGSWKKLDKNPYIAAIEFMNLRLTAFAEVTKYIGLKSYF
jgi:hypothetical protein